MDVKIEGLEKIDLMLDEIADVNKLENLVAKAALIVERKAKENAAKDTGALRRSIKSEVENDGGTITGIVYAGEEYAPYIEYGSGMFAENGGSPSGYWVYVKDSVPSNKPANRYTLEEAKRIVAIMRSKGLDAYYTNGQHPQPFLRPALNENREKIINSIKRGLAK